MQLSTCLPTFPGAVGFGSETVAGRSGTVFKVTSLADSGPGTLRAALDADAASRTVLFDIGGTITVTTPLVVPDRTTIAGQSAPADSGGITIRADPSLGSQTMTISGSDVLVRFLRFRRGASTAPTCCGDNVLVYETSNVVLDHLSVSWAVDENINSWGGASNITLSNSLSAEALYDSSHEKGPHSMGLLFGNGRNCTVVRSLFTKNVGRNPQMDLVTGIEVVNNFIASTTNTIQLVNREFPPTTVFDVDATEANVVGNRFDHHSTRNGVLVSLYDNPYKLYVKDNIGCQRTSTTQPETDIVGNSINSDDPPANFYVSVPNNLPTRTLDEGNLLTHDQVEAHVLAHSGCTRPVRDAVDIRLVADVAAGGDLGRIDDPSDVGGWPNLAAGTPRTDTDGDGIPDDFEAKLGTSPSNAADGAIVTASGYTNLELWLNSAELLGDDYVEIPGAPAVPPAGTSNPTPTSSGDNPNQPGGGTTFTAGPTATTTAAPGDSAGGVRDEPSSTSEANGDDLVPLYIVIAVLAVLVVILAVGVAYYRARASPARAAPYHSNATGGTRLSAGARRRSSNYRRA
uniref:Pectate lyase n=1 Tax=Sexangularia sp. CB-2014 TaxID=1486929 RepID=A0A7S1YIT2_9EUKA